MVTALNENYSIKKNPNTKSTLIYMGSCPITGVLYLHKWATGWQELVFNSQIDAKEWAIKNNAGLKKLCYKNQVWPV